MTGWTYAFAQNLALLALVAVLGVVVGLLLAKARAAARGRAAGAVAGGDEPLTQGAASEQVATSEVAGESPQETADHHDTPTPIDAVATTPPGEAADDGEAGEDDSERVADLQEQLEAARTYVEWLSAQIEEVQGQAAVEYGRLEAAALRALDETISADQLRIARLQDELAAAQAEQQNHRQHMLVNEQRFESLRAALADRDARIAELDNELVELRRPWGAQKVKEGPR